jgi:phage shock protein PspC (stress-responsive transcriptional regulator)
MRRHHFRFNRRYLALDPVNKKFGGVCAGVARYLHVPSLYVRVVTLIALCCIPQVVLIAYGLGYIILDEVDDEPY